jgi:transcriptional regulator GlxA family with amidase domain
MQHDRHSQLSGLDLEHSTMIDVLCASMREQPEKITDMQMLAKRAHCSVDHMIRIFKRHKGVTPWEFLIACRIEKASNLLRFSSHSVSQIADLVGYADIYSFCKQFKSRTGLTPSQYRKTP